MHKRIQIYNKLEKKNKKKLPRGFVSYNVGRTQIRRQFLLIGDRLFLKVAVEFFVFVAASVC